MEDDAAEMDRMAKTLTALGCRIVERSETLIVAEGRCGTATIRRRRDDYDTSFFEAKPAGLKALLHRSPRLVENGIYGYEDDTVYAAERWCHTGTL